MDLEHFFQSLKLNGSIFEIRVLKEIKKELELYINKEYSLNQIIEIISKTIKEATMEFLYTSDAISAISSSIYIDTKYLINIIGGNKNNGEKINDDTFFDIASITKMYMGLLVLKLKELDLIDFNEQLNNLTSSFHLDNYTINDILNMCGIIRTSKRLNECKDKYEALEELKKIYIFSDDKKLYNYTDMGIIVLTFILEEIFDMKYEELLDQYLLKPLHLSATYKPSNNVTGNGRSLLLPNDPKAIILDDKIGSAGLFTNSMDFVLLSRQLFNSNYIASTDLINFCINRTEKPRGINGSYTKHPLGLEKTYVPNEYSSYSFAFEGFTGSVVVFDLINRIHNNILVNAIYENTLLKHPLFNQKMNWYQGILAQSSIKLLFISKYFDNHQTYQKKIKI